jgi:hypothetical protein
MIALEFPSSLALPIWIQGTISENAPNGKTAKKIQSFGKLPDGWHYGTGERAPDSIVSIALEYLSYFTILGFEETDAFPGIDGEIMLTAYKRSHCIEVTVEVDKTFTIAHQIDRKDHTYETDLSGISASLEITRIVREIEQEEWNSLGSLIHSTMIIGTGSLGHSLLQYLRMAPQSLIQTVHVPRAGQYAPSSINTTGALVGLHQHSGLLTTPYLAKTAP